MNKVVLLPAFYVLTSTVLFAQNHKASYPSRIPDGTILPVQLNTTIALAKVRSGQAISARIAQDVPLENGTKLRAGTKVLGHIIGVTPGKPSRITFTFDKIASSKSEFLFAVMNLRALASYLEIDTASIPTTGPDRGTPSVWWNTVQVGGEDLYGDGPLARGDQILGHWVPGGAVGKIEANGKCRGEVADNAREQALWVFSTDACGIYGYPNLAIEHAGRTTPVGEITLSSTNLELQIRAGSGMLLRVDSSSLVTPRHT